MKKKMKLGEQIAYIGWNVITLGAPWLMKIVIKKAILEAQT